MPCEKGMPVRKDDQPGSGCYAGCLHRQMVMEYYAARLAYETEREDTTIGYGPETADYHREVGTFTFGQWLEQRARSPRMHDEEQDGHQEE